jgi:GH24 family phage-related lysozyme (muramidase)
MDFNDIACNIIKEFEGFVPKPYKCPAGVWTIGYGTTVYPNGMSVKSTDAPITETQAVGFLKQLLIKQFVPTLSRKIPSWWAMNDNQKAAVISFAYNLGANFYNSNGFNTISKALSARANWLNVPSALMLYINPGSSFEAGLRRRRAAEGELWQGKGKFAKVSQGC